MPQHLGHVAPVHARPRPVAQVVPRVPDGGLIILDPYDGSAGADLRRDAPANRPAPQ